jgi:hypothetical protein
VPGGSARHTSELQLARTRLEVGPRRLDVLMLALFHVVGGGPNHRHSPSHLQADTVRSRIDQKQVDVRPAGSRCRSTRNVADAFPPLQRLDRAARPAVCGD